MNLDLLTHSRRQPHVPVVRLDLPCRGGVPICPVRTSSPRLHMRGKPPTASGCFSSLQTWRAGRQKTATQVTTSLRPRWSRKRGAPDFLSPSALGCLRSLRFLASWSTTPSLSAAPLWGEPSPCKAHTSVVSKANWDPPIVGNPSATTSNLRLSAASGKGKSRSRTRTLVVTWAPVSLFWCMMHGGGQTNRLDGHRAHAPRERQ